jgi:RNA polymerase sigma factor (sigma-70 family)
MRQNAGKALSDQDLVEGCLAGKPAMQRALYERFAGRMLGVCLRYAGDRMEAEDVLHLAFMKVFTKMESYRGGALEGWVRTICVREAINHYHAKKRQKINYGEDENLPVEEAPAEALAMLSLQDLKRLVETLPEGAKIIFKLYAVEGFDHAEIAEMLNISVGTSKSQLSRARKLLQDRLVTYEKS